MAKDPTADGGGLPDLGLDRGREPRVVGGVLSPQRPVLSRTPCLVASVPAGRKRLVTSHLQRGGGLQRVDTKRPHSK